MIVGNNKKNFFLIFLVIESNFLFLNNSFKKIFKKKKENFLNVNLNKKSHFQRIFEQIKIFLNFRFHLNIKNNFFLIISYEKAKWILPHRLKAKNLSMKKNLELFLLNKIFYQEKKILKTEKNIKKSIYHKNKKKNLIFFLSSILYIFEKNIKLKIFGSFKILNFLTKKTKIKNLNNIKKLILGCQKSGIIFDTFIFGKNDSSFFHNLSGKTDGIYCRPLKNLFRIAYTEEFLEIMISVFLPTIYTRQLFILPFSVKSLTYQNLNKDKNKTHFLCSYCYSFFLQFPTSCYICGIDFNCH